MKGMKDKPASEPAVCHELSEDALEQAAGGTAPTVAGIDQLCSSTLASINVSNFDMSINRDINDYGPIITSNNAPFNYGVNRCDSIITSNTLVDTELKTGIVSPDLILHNEVAGR